MKGGFVSNNLHVIWLLVAMLCLLNWKLITILFYKADVDGQTIHFNIISHTDTHTHNDQARIWEYLTVKTFIFFNLVKLINEKQIFVFSSQIIHAAFVNIRIPFYHHDQHLQNGSTAVLDLRLIKKMLFWILFFRGSLILKCSF